MSAAPIEITVREAMVISSYSRLHIYGLVYNRRIKSRKEETRTGPLILIDRSSFLEYLKKRLRPVNEPNT